SQAGGLVDLGTLGGSASGALAVNTSGLVVGYASTTSEDWHVAYWAPAGAVVDLGGTSQSSAYAVNDTGQIVGSILSPGDSAMHAFSWTQAGRLVDPRTLARRPNIPETVTRPSQVRRSLKPARVLSST